MKSLLFDLIATQPCGLGKRHGGGKYGEMVFFRMLERGIKFSCMYDSRVWLNPEIESACREHGIPLYDIKKESVQTIVSGHGIDRVYSALPGERLSGISEGCELYGTLHGLRSLELPCDSYFLKYQNSFRKTVKYFIGRMFPAAWKHHLKKKCIRYFFKSGVRLITVSEHSRMAIASWFPEFHVEVKTFFSPNTSKNGEFMPDSNAEVSGRYLVLVSGNRWEKNNLRAIMAFDRLVSNNLVDASVRMKVTGCSAESFKYKIKNKDRFDFLGYVDEDCLARLYANAYLFVYPSLNEGFGYPPLEAMRYKVPVIASPFTSIAEICSGGALFFNPFSVEEIMNRILMMMLPQVHEEYARKGYERYLTIKERQDRDLDALIDYLVADDPR